MITACPARAGATRSSARQRAVRAHVIAACPARKSALAHKRSMLERTRAVGTCALMRMRADLGLHCGLERMLCVRSREAWAR